MTPLSLTQFLQSLSRLNYSVWFLLFLPSSLLGVSSRPQNLCPTGHIHRKVKESNLRGFIKDGEVSVGLGNTPPPGQLLLGHLSAPTCPGTCLVPLIRRATPRTGTHAWVGEEILKESWSQSVDFFPETVVSNTWGSFESKGQGLPAEASAQRDPGPQTLPVLESQPQTTRRVVLPHLPTQAVLSLAPYFDGHPLILTHFSQVDPEFFPL